jgi:hypothetical protein
MIENPSLVLIRTFWHVKRTLVWKLIRNGFKTSDRVQRQGAGCCESAAYTVVCEHSEETRNAVLGC